MNSPQRVDAHQHFWRRARGDYRWLRDDNAALAPLLRDFEPGELQPLCAAHGVVQTVLVQAADSIEETDFMLALADAHPFVAGVVGWVDMSQPDSVAHLERWAAHPKFKGVRPMLQDLADGQWIAHAPHPAVVAALLRLGLRFDALVKPAHLDGLLRFAAAWPTLPIVVDHAAKPQLAAGWDAPWAVAWRAGLRELATLPQVACKFSGLLTEATPAQCRQPLHTLRPVWDELLQGFGPQRLLWGSDWPVLNLAAPYAQWVETSDELLADLPLPLQDAVRQHNARRFYGLAAA